MVIIEGDKVQWYLVGNYIMLRPYCCKGLYPPFNVGSYKEKDRKNIPNWISNRRKKNVNNIGLDG